jgi:glutamate:GABA antiporter
VALLIILGQSGTSVRGAYNVLIEMMVVGSMVPFLLFFAAAIKLSGGSPRDGDARIWGGRPTVIAMAALGMITTAGTALLAFVPPPEEPDRVLAVAKVAGLTSVLLISGAAVYLMGRRQARLQAARAQFALS